MEEKAGFSNAYGMHDDRVRWVSQGVKRMTDCIMNVDDTKATDW